MKHLLAFPFPFIPAIPPGHGETYCGRHLPLKDPDLVNHDECVMRDLPVEVDCPDCCAALVWPLMTASFNADTTQNEGDK